MSHRRKRMLAVAISGILAVKATYAQAGAPVFDITNFMQAIQNGITMVDQLQAAYNQIEATYQQVQAQIKAMKELDLAAVTNDPIGALRGLMTYADRMMTYEENIESLLQSETIKFGSKSFSISDVFKRDTYDENGKLANAWDDPFERQLSDVEKAQFWSQYGMSPRHYLRYQAIGKATGEAAGKAVGLARMLVSNQKEDREMLKALIETNIDGSTVAGQQIANQISGIIAQDIKSMMELLGASIESGELQQRNSQTLEEAQKATIAEIQAYQEGSSEEFLKMITDEDPTIYK